MPHISKQAQTEIQQIASELNDLSSSRKDLVDKLWLMETRSEELRLKLMVRIKKL